MNPHKTSISKVKYVLFIFQLIGIISISLGQNQSTNQIDSGELIIEINDLGVSINSFLISDTTKLLELIKIVGEPSRSNIPDDSKVEELKENYPANKIYTYDDYGILIYQKHNTNTISSLRIIFIKQKYDFSPHSSFAGKLLINDKTVDRHSDEGKLKKIKGLELDTPMFFYQKGVYNGYTLSFVNNLTDNTLITFEVDLLKIKQISHQDSWSKPEIKNLKKTILKDEVFMSKIETNLIIFNIKRKDFINCYVTKISKSFTPKQMSNPNSEILEVLDTLPNDCMLLLMK